MIYEIEIDEAEGFERVIHCVGYAPGYALCGMYIEAETLIESQDTITLGVDTCGGCWIARGSIQIYRDAYEAATKARAAMRHILSLGQAGSVIREIEG